MFCKQITLSSCVKVFNLILKTGCYPTSWKESYIILLHKTGSKLDPSNYRGISLTSTLPKIFNAVLNERLNQLMESQLSNCQFGFRKNHRTSDSIFILKSLFNKYIHKEKKKYMLVLLILRRLLTLYGEKLF